MLSMAFRRALPATRETTHGGVFYEIKDVTRDRTLRLNEVQYVVALHFDGRLLDAVRRALHQRYGLALSPRDLAALVEALAAVDLLEEVPLRADIDEFDGEHTVTADADTLQALALLPRLPLGAARFLREPITQVIWLEVDPPQSLVNRLRAGPRPAVFQLRAGLR